MNSTAISKGTDVSHSQTGKMKPSVMEEDIP